MSLPLSLHRPPLPVHPFRASDVAMAEKTFSVTDFLFRYYDSAWKTDGDLCGQPGSQGIGHPGWSANQLQGITKCQYNSDAKQLGQLGTDHIVGEFLPRF